MKERPIIMSTEMVKAILEYRKTQTRRIIKPISTLSGKYSISTVWELPSDPSGFACKYFVGQKPIYSPISCPYGNVGDRLWVRETFCQCLHAYAKKSTIYYKASTTPDEEHYYELKWTPSIFMPRWLSRITLLIVDVRIEQLHDMKEDNFYAEGIPEESPRASGPTGPDIRFDYGLLCFKKLWNSLNVKRGYEWETNPWVWVIEFKKIEKNRRHNGRDTIQEDQSR